MHERRTTGDLFGNMMGTIADNIPMQQPGSFFQERQSETFHFNGMYDNHQKPVHHIFGGGKAADVFLWRNKKISASVLSAATAVWILFEWLNYHFLTLVCFAMIFGMLAQFLWSNASSLINSGRSAATVPRLVLPDELFINIARSVGSQVNEALIFLQAVSCGGNPKQFLMVTGSLLAAAMIGSWCNFLTVMYIGFIAAHTLPVLYQRYDGEVNSFLDQLLGQFNHHYRNFDSRSLLARIANGSKGKKHY